MHDSYPHAKLPYQGEDRLIASGDAALSPALENRFTIDTTPDAQLGAGAGC
jgi:hypothetical protein